MQTNYDTLKKKRKSRRFFTYVGVYFLLWLAFRSLIEIFRGGDISIAFSEILLTGLAFGLLMGVYSIYKKHVIYINKDKKRKAIQVLTDLGFKDPKVYKGGKMLFVRDASQRFGRHDEVFMTTIENLIEIECEKNMKVVLEKKLDIV